ncbi:MAG: hypothetical protein WC091_03330 [Sulfuricellaceae bacterium]
MAEDIIRQSDTPADMVSKPASNYFELVELVLKDTKLEWEQKKLLIGELRKGNVTDRWTFRWAIWILGASVLLTIGALWALSNGKYDIPDGLVAIGSAAAGGLAGLLTPGRSSGRDTPP